MLADLFARPVDCAPGLPPLRVLFSGVQSFPRPDTALCALVYRVLKKRLDVVFHPGVILCIFGLPGHSCCRRRRLPDLALPSSCSLPRSCGAEDHEAMDGIQVPLRQPTHVHQVLARALW